MQYIPEKLLEKLSIEDLRVLVNMTLDMDIKMDRLILLLEKNVNKIFINMNNILKNFDFAGLEYIHKKVKNEKTKEQIDKIIKERNSVFEISYNNIINAIKSNDFDELYTLLETEETKKNIINR